MDVGDGWRGAEDQGMVISKAGRRPGYHDLSDNFAEVQRMKVSPIKPWQEATDGILPNPVVVADAVAVGDDYEMNIAPDRGIKQRFK